MMDNVADGHIERLVKAKWLAMGLSQSDLAEILDSALAQTQDGAGLNENEIDGGRLRRIAETLDLPLGYFNRPTRTEVQDEVAASNEASDTLETLLGLRLLRAFNEMQDARAKRMLVHLAEQIVKRQANRRGGG